MTNPIEVDSTQTPIHSVCVYQDNSDCANIRRIYSVELKVSGASRLSKGCGSSIMFYRALFIYLALVKAGQNEVHLKNLPNRLDQDSIRVEGLENATIFDVIYKAPRPTLASSYEQDTNLRASKKLLAALQSEKKILEDQAGFLDEYAKTLGADKAGGMSLDAFLKLYGDEKKRISGELADLEDTLEEAKKDVRESETRLAQDDRGKRRTAQVTVVVLADSDGQADFSLSYGKQAERLRTVTDTQLSTAVL